MIGNDSSKLKLIIQSALSHLHEFIQTTDWIGRENEVVNLFAHDMLIHEISAASPLKSIKQIGIEVAVKQLDGNMHKRFVRKDLVIWSRENMTVWNLKSDELYNSPLAILEWKINDEKKCSCDIEWLKTYTKKSCTIGYSICVNIKGQRKVTYWEIESGNAIKIQ